MSASFQATIRSGFGSGGFYVSLPYYSTEFQHILGKVPFPGTLNVSITQSDIEAYYRHLEALDAIIIPAKVENNQHHWKVHCFRCKISIPNTADSTKVDCLALEFSSPEHNRGIVELVSSVQLRTIYELKDGDTIRLDF